jgi:AhpD family alkylhydroperoxidase
MTRARVYKEIKEMMGVVPTMFKSIPDSSLELEWKLFKKVQSDKGAIPNKYRELIGLGAAAVMKCRYCTLFHTEMAKLAGATGAEIEEAVHFSKSAAGWSAYINGIQMDYNKFKAEINTATKYVRKQMKARE